MDLREAFQTALEFEQKGHDIYAATAGKTVNPIVKRTFNYLAQQEIYHIKEIKEYVKKLDDGHKVELLGDTAEQTKQFFTMTTQQFKQKTELSNDDIKAHETALELEQSAYDFYKEHHAQTDDADLRKFFHFLMKQENAHYEFIQKSYEFIKNPIGFYTEDEKWMADGG